MTLTYKGSELLKPGDNAVGHSGGPAFRQIYHRLFGPTFAGEYFAPSKRKNPEDGDYVLSYPGVAFTFTIQHKAWSPSADFVSLLSSPTTSPARSMSIFNGPSWKEAREDYLTRPCPYPRSLSLNGRIRDGDVDEVEIVKVMADRRVEISQRSHATFKLVLNETTPQDLVSQLGPPDAIYRKYDRKLSIHKHRSSSRSDHPPFYSGSPPLMDDYSDTDRSSTNTATDYSSPEEDTAHNRSVYTSTECFYNYFNHGFDVFVSFPKEPKGTSGGEEESMSNAGQLVATKLILHGNVPGSYMFNRYRRSRWKLCPHLPSMHDGLGSETPFREVSKNLQPLWDNTYIDDAEKKAMMTPMVLNRDWGDSPTSSFEFADLKTSTDEAAMNDRTDPQLGTTRLFGYPGLLFEVLRNDAISCLTIY